MDTKICSKCKVEKAVSEFYKDRKEKDGLNYWCRSCSKIIAKKNRSRYREINLNRKVNRRGKKRCGMCYEFLPRMLFISNQTNKDGLEAICPDCKALFNLTSLARIRGHSINIPHNLTGKHLRQLKKDQDYKCYFCGVKENGKKLHLDHNHLTGEIRGYACQNCNKGPLAYLELYESWGREKQIEMRKRYNNPPAKYLYQSTSENLPSQVPPIPYLEEVKTT